MGFVRDNFAARTKSERPFAIGNVWKRTGAECPGESQPCRGVNRGAVAGLVSRAGWGKARTCCRSVGHNKHRRKTPQCPRTMGPATFFLTLRGVVRTGCAESAGCNCEALVGKGQSMLLVAAVRWLQIYARRRNSQWPSLNTHPATNPRAKLIAPVTKAPIRTPSITGCCAAPRSAPKTTPVSPNTKSQTRMSFGRDTSKLWLQPVKPPSMAPPIGPSLPLAAPTLMAPIAASAKIKRIASKRIERRAAVRSNGAYSNCNRWRR